MLFLPFMAVSTREKKESESQFQSRVLKFLRTEYPDAYFWKASDRFIAGIPDIMGIYQGQAFGIELKVGKNKPTKLQLYTHEQMQKAGAIVGVCWTLDEVKLLMTRVIYYVTGVGD